MAVELGILLGPYNYDQSFAQVGSWAVLAGVSSLVLQSASVHSSGVGGFLTVASGAAANARALTHPYAAEFAQRASPAGGAS